MKRHYFILAILLTTGYSLVTNAQIRESKYSMSLGVQNGLSVSIPDAEEKLIDNVWKDYFKPYGKVKRNKKAKEEFSMDAVVHTIFGSNKMDVYIQTENNNAIVFFDLKTGFLSSEAYPREFDGAKIFVQEFAYEVEREKTRELLKEEEKKLDKLKDKLEDLVKDNSKYHKDIEDAKEKIKEREADIINNNRDQQSAKSDIENQTGKVQAVQNKLNSIGKKE